MEFYLFIFLLIVFLGFLDFTNIKTNRKKSLIVLISIILIFISSIRWETGTDWFSYINFFYYNNDLESFLQGNFEIGYAYLNYFVKNYISDNYNLLLAIIAIIVIGLKTRFILIYATLPCIAFLLNFSTTIGDLFSVRQSIALAITIFSVDFIISKNFWKFLLSVIFAASFHITALVFIPAYYIFHLKIKKEYWCLGFMICLIIVLTGIPSKIFLDGMSIVFGDGYLLEKSTIYLAGDAGVNNNVSSQTVIVLGLVRRFFFAPFLLYFKERFQYVNSHYEGFLNLTLIGYLLFLVFSDIASVVAARLSLYYFTYEIILISMLVLLGKNIFSKIYIFLFLVVFSAFKYYYALYAYLELYIPFISIFDKFSRNL